MPDAYAVDGLLPHRVLSPETPEALAAELARATEAGLAVVPLGGGTELALGNPPRGFDVALTTTHLNHVIDHSPEDLTVTVEAGITLAALQQALAPHGQQVTLDAPLPDRASIGGILATGASGPRRFSHGAPRERVIGIRVAHADGTLTKAGGRVVKNVTGYEMTRLYTGSLGTLGVIVEVSFKLAPLPAATATLAGILPSFESCPALIRTLLSAGLQPSAVDTLNAQAAGAIDGFPAPEQRQWTVAIEFAGSQAGVERQLRDAAAIMKDARLASVTALTGPAASASWSAVRDFGRPGGGGVIARMAVLPASLPALVPTLPEPMPAIVARAGNGIAYLHWTDPPAPESIETLRQAARSLGGSLVLEAAPAPLKDEIDVWGPPDASFSVMRRLKDLFDPRGTLNPGRFIGGI